MNVTPSVVLFALFSIILLIISFYIILSEVLVQKTWRPSYADIQSSTIELDYGSDYDPDYPSDDSSYWPMINYNYRYEGTEYSGYCCQSGFIDYAGAEKFLKKATTNNRVEIYVNPNNPSESRLKVDVDPFTFPNLTLLFIGALLTIISTTLLYIQSKA